MTLKSQANLSERSVSADRLPTKTVYHLQGNSLAQPIVKEVMLVILLHQFCIPYKAGIFYTILSNILICSSISSFTTFITFL